MLRQLKKLQLLEKLVRQAFAEQPKHWGFRMDADEHEGGFNDGVTYSAADLDRRPDFVKADDRNWDKQ